MHIRFKRSVVIVAVRDVNMSNGLAKRPPMTVHDLLSLFLEENDNSHSRTRLHTIGSYCKASLNAPLISADNSVKRKISLT